MNREFIEALDQLERSKHISKELLLQAIEAALVAAYKKSYGTSQNVRVVIDSESGDIQVLSRMEIVEEVLDETTQISLEYAHELDPRYEVGDGIEFAVLAEDFGRVAAQTAKQVVVQRIREAERGMVFNEFKERKGEIVTAVVQRKSGNTLFMDIGDVEGILPANEQVRGEIFNVNDRIKAYIMDVKDAPRGPQIFLSRSHPGLVKKLFELEVPEIQDGTVEVKGLAREAGSRSKIAVYTEEENVDAVGACVGARGSRVQAVVDELSGEKIDIISWSESPEELITNVLSPAKVEEIIIEEGDEEEKIATAIVPDYQLSLAIGKEGQNVRLAAKVSGWKIDIKSHSQYYGEEDDMLDDEDLFNEQEMIEDEEMIQNEEVIEQADVIQGDDTIDEEIVEANESDELEAKASDESDEFNSEKSDESDEIESEEEEIVEA